MIIGIPNFAASGAVAFTIAGKLLQSFQQSFELSLRLTHECGGQYQSLILSSARQECCKFNLLSGRIHFSQATNPATLESIECWPEPRNYLLAFLSDMHGLDRVTEDIAAALGFRNPKPTFYAGGLGITLGTLFSHFLLDPEQIRVENGWATEDSWPEWLESVPDDCMLTKPYDDAVAGMLWTVRFQEQSVLFDDNIAYLTGTTDSFDVCSEIGSNAGSPVYSRNSHRATS